MSERKELAAQWLHLVNMTPTALAEWSADPRHRLASTPAGWKSLQRIQAMRARPRDEWTDRDWEHARRVVNFLHRHLRSMVLFGQEVAQSGWSKRAIALRNWGHDPARSNSPAYRADKAWLKRHSGAAKRRQ